MNPFIIRKEKTTKNPATNLAQLSYENPSKRKQFCQVMAKEAVKEKFSTTYLGLHEDKHGACAEKLWTGTKGYWVKSC